MTATITKFRCPTCGHILGEGEHRVVIQRTRERDAAINAARDVQHRNEIRLIKEKYEEEKESEVSKRIREHAITMELGYGHELEEKDKQHAKELAEKDRQIEATKLYVEDQLQRAVDEKERKHEGERTGYREQIQRLEMDNRTLSITVEKQKKALDNMSSEFKGTKGERVLLDDLHNAFPDDELVPKIVGVEMADVVQTIVTENNEKIAPPIVWDMKTSDSVKPSDIYKAKKYKTTHNTDYSIIVTEKGITTKDSQNDKFGMRDGIHLVHPTAVVEVAKLIRDFIIKQAKQTNSAKDRTSKQARLYEYLKSSEYARTIEAATNWETKLDDLQRREEKYHKDTWNERKKLMDERRKTSESNQQKINGIMHDQTSEPSKDDLNEKEEE